MMNPLCFVTITLHFFYAGTGKIQGLQTRGIHSLIKILEG